MGLIFLDGVIGQAVGELLIGLPAVLEELFDIQRVDGLDILIPEISNHPFFLVVLIDRIGGTPALLIKGVVIGYGFAERHLAGYAGVLADSLILCIAAL